MLYQIKAPHFVAAFEIDSDTGRMLSAAPIIGWMRRKRWNLDMIRAYCASKGWDCDQAIQHPSCSM